ncbi:polyprenyl synthetase [Streptomyces sp. NBC_00620]|uniref:polyprenyl synthetase n=1 Tax=unclassified Streptomyces TaxID=2593676 RepID=UPI00224FD57B|nr:polyprenyl synthetase [Streptomyces sp. NBC_00620]MCX4976298.1 polyprenyl synthetase [Streptomyces sp. NBC_00620]WUC09593.1 polyprenyl synthetase [Streptomyces sp. NBC_00564]
MTQEAGRRGGLDGQTLLVAVGLADLAVSTVGSALGTVRGLLRRSDAAELAAEAENELVARGRLVLDRYADVPPAHLEILARRALARKAAGDV